MMRSNNLHQWPFGMGPDGRFLLTTDIENSFMPCPYCLGKPVVFTPSSHNRKGLERVGVHCFCGCAETGRGVSTELIANYKFLSTKLRKSWHAMLYKVITQQIIKDCVSLQPLPEELEDSVGRLLKYREFMLNTPDE